jgi:hypothetical protein
MGRYAEEAGNALGATIVHAMWRHAIAHAVVISTDATSALIQPQKRNKKLRQACKKAHFFTAVVDADAVLFAYAERHTQQFVKELFDGFTGFLQSDASSVYDVLERGPPKDNDESVSLVGCWAHCRRYFFEAAVCRYSVGVQGLMRIRALYAIDDAFAKLAPDKRKQLREQHLRPALEDFFAWVGSARASTEGRNLATKALGYAHNQKGELMRVLADGRLPLEAPCGRSSSVQELDVLCQRHARRECRRPLFADRDVSPTRPRPRTVPRRSDAPAALLATRALPRARREVLARNACQA